jgi:hypothetical protein
MADSAVEKKILESLITISNNFFRHGGFFTKVEPISGETMRFIVDWMKNQLNCDLRSMYLMPNCVHYWSLNIYPIKQNFLRFLCWANNFSDKSMEVDILGELFIVN